MTGNELIERPDWGDGERLPAVTDVSAVAAGGTILGRTAAAVATVEASLDADEYQALDTALAELPDTVKAAIRSEIALSPDSRARPVSDDIVAKFRADPAGEVLAKEWRAMTPEKVAVFHARLRRIVDAVPAADREAAAQWAEARTTAEQVAIIGPWCADGRPSPRSRSATASGPSAAAKQTHELAAGRSFTEDSEAVVASMMRGGTTAPPEDKPPDFSTMSNAEFAAEVKRKYGYSPTI